MAVVAVVNDDDAAREIAARIIERDGHTTHRISSPEEAVVAAERHNIDLFVLDLLGGGPAANRHVLAQVRAAMPDAETRAVVVGLREGAGILAWQAGADGFLLRPFHARDLLRSIDEVLARPDGEREAHRHAAITDIATS